MKKLPFAFFLWSIVSPAMAQDTHYWTQQFGTRSALLGGAIVAGSSDNTVIYYNPGALGFIDTGSISINANLYHLENIRIFNALGQKSDFKSSQLASVPLLVGGMFKNKGNAWRIGYGLITPVNFDFKATARIDTRYNITNDAESPGEEELIGQQDLSTKLSETALGIGAGRRINEYWSFGLTGFFQVRSLNFSKASLVRYYLNNNDHSLVSATLLQNTSYYNVRFIPKLGIVYKKNSWSAGLTITAPSLNLFGRGKVAGDATATNIRPKVSEDRLDFVANDRQEKLKTKFKSPFSVAMGLSYRMNRSQLHLSTQYFGAIKEYNIIQAAPTTFARPENLYPEFTSDEFLRVRAAAKQVFNVVLGYEYSLRPDVDLYASFRTDNSYFDKSLLEQRGIKPDITSWNINHITTGATFKKGRSQMSIGLLYSFGIDDNRAQTGNMENVTEDNFLLGSTKIVKAKYSSLGFLLGYTFNFRKF